MDFLPTVLAALISVETPSRGKATAHASITLHLHAPSDRALRMFDPVNESRWAPDWHPTFHGDARIVSGLVFTTREEDGRAIWLLDRYDRSTREIRYVNVRSTTLSTIDISLKQDGTNASIATVTYERTALDSRGDESVASFAHDFHTQGPHWEHAINTALASS